MTPYCPKCGDTMTEAENGYLEWARGGMPLVPELEQRLRECYMSQLRRPCDVVFTYRDRPHRIGGVWFCPGCGVLAQESTPGDLRCPSSSQSLVEFVYSLVERHHHSKRVREP